MDIFLFRIKYGIIDNLFDYDNILIIFQNKKYSLLLLS